MSIIKHAIIGAAGIGSRLGLDIPKCLVNIGGKKIIEFQLDVLSEIEDIRIVVGYKEEILIDQVCNIRKDIIFVRNPHYATTSTMQSMFLAAIGLHDPVLVLDGDVIIEKKSFGEFLNNCIDENLVIGITKSKSEDSVFVNTEIIENKLFVTGFSRTIKSDYEWTGIAFLSPGLIENKNIYFYEMLQNHLPLRAAIIDCYEIDTQLDLDQVNNFFLES